MNSDPREGPETENTAPEWKDEIAPPPVRRRRALVFQGVVLGVLALFSILALLAQQSNYFAADLAMARALQAYDPQWMQILMWVVSWPGFGPQSILIVAGVSWALYWLGLRTEGVVSALAGLSGLLISTLVKLAVARPRPSADLVEVLWELSDFSFPSGHVMFYTSFFGFLWFLSFTLLEPSWKRTLLLGVFGGLVALVGMSRVYLGQHWPSDTLGAYLLGALVLMAAILIYRRLKPEAA